MTRVTWRPGSGRMLAAILSRPLGAVMAATLIAGCVVHAPAATSPSPAASYPAAPPYQDPQPFYAGAQPGAEAWLETPAPAPAPVAPADEEP